MNPPRALYIHVPFCARRCAYCDFAVHATRTPPVFAWLEAIAAEIRLVAQEQQWVLPVELDTIYVGGGTPSLLGVGAMAELAARLAEVFTWDARHVEWTCEANPESFTPALARDWFAAGVNRISLGAQTFNPAALRWMGRLHGPSGPERAMAAARAAGFDNVSIDLIFALPERLGRDWADDLTRALLLEPEHVSLYGLTAEAGAPLGRWVREQREHLPDEDGYADEYLLAHRLLGDAGFEHYEVSNFARPGRRSLHNATYWTGAPYAALGPGAHAFYPPARRWNVRDWRDYQTALGANRLPVDDQELIGPAEHRVERTWLGLRTDMGLGTPSLSHGQRSLASRWREAGLAHPCETVLRLTARGWLLLDTLAVALGDAGSTPVARSDAH